MPSPADITDPGAPGVPELEGVSGVVQHSEVLFGLNAAWEGSAGNIQFVLEQGLAPGVVIATASVDDAAATATTTTTGHTPIHDSELMKLIILAVWESTSGKGWTRLV